MNKQSLKFCGSNYHFYIITLAIIAIIHLITTGGIAVLTGKDFTTKIYAFSLQLVKVFAVILPRRN